MIGCYCTAMPLFWSIAIKWKEEAADETTKTTPNRMDNGMISKYSVTNEHLNISINFCGLLNAKTIQTD